MSDSSRTNSYGRNNQFFSKGSITIEFVFAMIIAAAILAPVIPMVLEMSREVMQGVLGRVSNHWP